MPDRGVRILHILPSLADVYGGPLRLTLDLSARAEPLGLFSEVLGIGEPTIRDNPLSPSRIHSVPLGFGNQPYAYAPKLRQWLAGRLRSFDGVVVHGAWTYPGWAAASECQKMSVPFACFAHGMLEQWAVDGQGWISSVKKRLYWLLREHQIWQRAQAVFFTTAMEQRRTCRAFTLNAPSVILRPYGIERSVDEVPCPRNRALSQPSHLKIALFLGRLHPKKNLRLLIEAWRRSGVGPEWRLVIAGSGAESYQNELFSLVRNLGLNDRVVFAGFVTGTDKAYLLQRADWFLLPSSQENFGVAVLEAVQHGCAVAISDQVYLAESMRPASEVIPATLEAWTEFCRSRMQNPDWVRSTRDLDYTHLAGEFGMDQIVRNWVDTLSRTFPPRRESVPNK